jgi:hypothetical protein
MSNQAKLEKLLVKDGFTPFRKSDELMNDLKALPDGKRCGIYIHMLPGGEYFYVGLSVDVRDRYQQHKQTYHKIEKSAFLSAPKNQIGILEQKYISMLYRMKLKLLNILIPDDSSKAGDLSDSFGVEAQNEWIADSAAKYKGKGNTYSEELLKKFEARYEKLMSSADFKPEYLDFISTFIRYCIPHPEKSEKVFWTLNCLTNAFQKHPARALFRVSVHRPEVLTFVVNHKDPAMEPFMVMFTLFPEAMTAKEFSEINKIGGFEIVDNVFKSADFDHIHLRASSMETAWKLLAHEGFRRAIKQCVLKLMQKGQVPRNFSQSHCLPLCADVMKRSAKI